MYMDSEVIDMIQMLMLVDNISSKNPDNDFTLIIV